MSFTITTDVFCDECSDWTFGTTGHTPCRSEAWKNAKTSGWTKIKGRHLCPICNGNATHKYNDNSYIYKDNHK